MPTRTTNDLLWFEFTDSRAPTPQQKILFEAAVNQSYFDWRRFLRTNNAIFIEWVDLAPDLSDPYVTFTNVSTGYSPSTPTLQIHNGLDTIGDPRYAGQDFYIEAVMHGLGEAFYKNRVANNKYIKRRVTAISIMPKPGSGILDHGRDQLDADRPGRVFGIAEIFKDIFTPKDLRRYTNRSQWQLRPQSWEWAGVTAGMTGFEVFVQAFMDEVTVLADASTAYQGTVRNACSFECVTENPLCEECKGADENSVPSRIHFPCHASHDTAADYSLTPGQAPVVSPTNFPAGRYDFLNLMSMGAFSNPNNYGLGFTSSSDCGSAFRSYWVNGYFSNRSAWYSVGNNTEWLVGQSSGDGGVQIPGAIDGTFGMFKLDWAKYGNGTRSLGMQLGRIMAPSGGIAPWPLAMHESWNVAAGDEAYWLSYNDSGFPTIMDPIVLCFSKGHPKYPYGVEGRVQAIPSPPGMVRTREKRYKGLRDPFQAPAFV